MTASRPPKPTFVLTLEPTPRWNDPSGMRRLRGLLKHLLRAWGMRVKRIDYPGIEPPPAGSEATNALGPSSVSDGP